MARFGQKDIVRGTITDALSLNRYSYCENDPINFCDPSGMRAVVDIDAASVASKPKTTTTSKAVTKPVQSQTQYVNPTNIPKSNAASVADSKAAMDYMNRTAPNSPQAQRAREEYQRTVNYANAANATHNPNLARMAQNTAMKNVSFANNVTPAKPSGNGSSTGGGNSYSPTTSSPTVQSPVQESGNCNVHKILDLVVVKTNAINKVIDFYSGKDQNIAALGVSGSAGLGLDLAFSLMLVMDRSGNMGIVITVGAGGGLGASIGAGGYSNPNAELIGDLSGVGVDVGGTVAVITLDADNSGGLGVSFGKAGLEFHSLITRTFIIDIF